MNTQANRNWMSEADDLLFKMRMLAGSGDYDAGADALRAMLDLYNDASAWDRENPEDDGMNLTYILNTFEHCIDHVTKGIAIGNKSRTAIEAAAYRNGKAA